MNDQYIHIPVRREYKSSALLPGNDFNIADSVMIEQVLLQETWWCFPETTITGDIEHRHGNWIGDGSKYALAKGYRCLKCRKVFFATGLDFHHAPCSMEES